MRVTITSNRKQSLVVNINKYPDECPFCHLGIVPNFLNGFQHVEKGILHLAFYCPRLECNNYFVSEYEHDHSDSFYFTRTLLGRLKLKDFSETIIGISSDFVEIFYQAEAAEHNGLNQICGVGYRKALEFLIKDYIIYKDNNLQETVEKLLLGKCINDHIKNDRIKI